MNPYTSLIQKHEVISSGILEHINNNTIVLHFENPQLQTHNVVTNDNTAIFNQLGGRNNISSMHGRQDQGHASGVYQATLPTGVPCRVYWNDKKLDPALNLKNDKDICKLRTFNQYSNQLNNAVYAIIDNKKCTMVKPPKADGIGGNQWCNSYWEVSVG